MKNSDYWKLRFEQLEKAQNKLAEMSRAEIETLYRQAVKEIEGKINTWYQRLAANNGVSMAEARKLLNASELNEFKWDVHDYIKYGQDNALSGQWTKQLENASAKFHISKYEALKIQTQQSLEALFAKQAGITSNTMKEVYQSGYYHTAFEIQKGFGVGRDISGIDQNRIEKVISKPWAVDGKNFSERIWGNKQKLISEVHKELTQNIMLGADPQKAIDIIAKKMNTSKYNAGRLVMTEEAYFSSVAQKDCFVDLGVEEYEIVATLDSHTSEICQNMDGKHFPMKDFEAGVTAPPFHVFCRSTTCPWFEDDYGEVGERAARDEKTGKTYYVPADLTYKEWKKGFVDGDKSDFGGVDNSKESDIIRSSGFNDHTANEHFIEKLSKIDPNDNEAVTKELTKFIKDNADSKIERCLVIAENGEMYQVHGSEFTVNTDLLGDVMKGSINIHNHVKGDSQYSFSYEDLMSSVADKSKLVLAFDEKFVYSMLFEDTVDEDTAYFTYKKAYAEIEERLYNCETILDEDIQHEIIKLTCEALKITYRRNHNDI